MSDDPKPDLPPHPAVAARTTRRNFYGRVHGKTLRQSQKGYLAEDLAQLRLRRVSRDENPERGLLDLDTALPGAGPLWVEVGFGGGEHLVHMASLYPEVRLIGCEPFVNGVAMALGLLRQAPTGVVALHPGDARDLFDVLPPASVAKCFLNYPDPWPKSRHHRRRFVTPGHLAPLFSVMAPGGEFRIATDIPSYSAQAKVEVPKAGFELVSEGGVPWGDWASTRYEKKALREGRVPHYMTFRRP